MFRRRDRFPFHKQLDAMDCGPSCLRMVAEKYGKHYSLEFLRRLAFMGHDGVSLMGLSHAAEQIGLRSMGVLVPAAKLDEMILPCIAHWRQNHFVVVYKVKGDKVYVADPAHGRLVHSRKAFVEGWTNGRDQGILLLLEPTPDFYQHRDQTGSKAGFQFLFSYLRAHKKSLVWVFLFMLAGSLLQMVFPFLTQGIVDRGIRYQNLNIIYLLLLGRLVLYVGSTLADFLRSRILLRVGTRINIAIISDFLAKLMKLPIAFFTSKTTGDLLQRINDHYRIESFLTSTTLSILFALIQLAAFSVVLIIYYVPIFFIFMASTFLYTGWLLFFMRKRRHLDFRRFEQLSENQSVLIQLIRGMQAIKLGGAERQKRWEWQQIQERLFRVNIDSLMLHQYQQGGALLLNELKDVLISLLAATAVIRGDMTLGMMMAVQYVIGSLNSPVRQILSFLRTAQDAQISFERLGEIHNREEEETGEGKIRTLPENAGFDLRNVSFHYEGPHSPYVLRDLELQIPAGRVTAVVGPSGSGKTTLLKLLLKFYEPDEGQIRLGGIQLSQIEHGVWRKNCGVVMQDGYLFSDIIAHNITLGDEEIDYDRLRHAAQLTNIHDFITSLPLGYDTKVGAEGHGLSQGQKQRILIARAIYKNPAYLFFDEATNALDADNEYVIMKNLEQFYKGRTAVIVAHRLSTVQKADQIVVLDQGRIIERGTHADLVARRGAYYHLVRNQLELGT